MSRDRREPDDIRACFCDILGEIYDYFPAVNEMLASVSILAEGTLAFTLTVKVATPILLDHTTNAPGE